MVHDGPVTKEKLSVCRCRDGFHCPTEACITCVAHSLCAAGQRVKDKGIMSCSGLGLGLGVFSVIYFDLVVTFSQGTILLTQCVKIVRPTHFLLGSLQTVTAMIGLCK